MKLKRPRLRRSSESSKTDVDEQIEEAVTDAIRTPNDKVVEIRPVNESKGRGRRLLMMLAGAALAVGYWLRRSRGSSDGLKQTASETADRARDASRQAGESIQKSGGTMAARVEGESRKAGEQIQETGETMADRVEEGSQKAGEQVQETGEDAAEKTEAAGEEATEKMDERDEDSSSGS